MPSGMVIKWNLRSHLHESPLLGYAASHWGDHARKVEETCKGTILDFLKKKPNVACVIAILLVTRRPYLACR